MRDDVRAIYRLHAGYITNHYSPITFNYLQGKPDNYFSTIIVINNKVINIHKKFRLTATRADALSSIDFISAYVRLRKPRNDMGLRRRGLAPSYFLYLPAIGILLLESLSNSFPTTRNKVRSQWSDEEL